MNNQSHSGSAGAIDGSTNYGADRPKAGSSADLRVVNNDGPTFQGLQAIAEQQCETQDLIERFERVLGKILASGPPTDEEKAGRDRMETDLGEALYLRFERQRGLNAQFNALLERVRL